MEGKVKVRGALALFVLKRDNWTCQKCGKKLNPKLRGSNKDWDAPEVDHVVPGGGNDPSNLRCLCMKCNRPGRPVRNLRLHAIMKERGCTRERAYVLLRREKAPKS